MAGEATAPNDIERVRCDFSRVFAPIVRGLVALLRQKWNRIIGDWRTATHRSAPINMACARYANRPKCVWSAVRALTQRNGAPCACALCIKRI